MFLSFDIFGQLVIYDSKDTSDYFRVDTLRISGDSTFITVFHQIKDKLIQRESQIKIRYKGESSCNPSDPGSDLYVIKIISHGESIEWYPNGQMKSQGTFYFNKKNSDWKYWNSDGKQIPAPDEGSNIKIRGKTTYFIDGIKAPRQK
jgi:hypothetical protein